MPTISYFYGIKITMNPNEHNPPHFHVKYAEFEAQIAIRDGAMLAGTLPVRVRALTEEWRLLNVEAILENWELMLKSNPIKPIKGLD